MDTELLRLPDGLDPVTVTRFVIYLVRHGGLIENVDGQPVLRASVAELMDLVGRFELAWRSHPDFYPTFPPAAMSVWSHEAYRGHTESYVMAGMSDVTSPAHLKWGRRSLGEYAGIRPVPPELPVSREREIFLSFSLKGAGKAFRARRELKRLLPRKYRGYVQKARHFRRDTKYMAYKALRGGINPEPDAEYRHTRADEYRFRLFSWHYADKLAGLPIGLRDFWRIATGQVHPDQVATYFTRQTELFTLPDAGSTQSAPRPRGSAPNTTRAAPANAPQATLF